MRQTWRWFGPKDLVSVDDMLQAGVEGVVTALHHVPTGAVWTADEIGKRQDEIARMTDGAASGLAWEVVESLPVSEDIKKQQGAWREHIDNYKSSLENLAAAGIEVICYNFMPVLDWTRTDLAWRLRTGATCMRFDYADFAAFDIHVLRRGDAPGDYPEETVEEAARRFASMDDGTRKSWSRTSCSACRVRPSVSRSAMCARTWPSTKGSRPVGCVRIWSRSSEKSCRWRKGSAFVSAVILTTRRFRCSACRASCRPRPTTGR